MSDKIDRDLKIKIALLRSVVLPGGITVVRIPYNFFPFENSLESELFSLILSLKLVREQYRKKGNYRVADNIRSLLEKIGVRIEDRETKEISWNEIQNYV
jgi:cysteinyl-tRNA synthetase